MIFSPRPLLLLLVMIFAAVFGPTFAQDDSHKSWDYPPFGANDIALYQGFQASCSKFMKMSASKQLHRNKMFGTAGQWQTICVEGLAKTPEQLTEYLNSRLTKVKMGTTAKFTGYFKPVLEGSRTRHGVYQTPLLERPKDLTICNGETGQLKANGQCLNPYPTRHEIESNLGDYKVLVWLKDPLDTYFLHIQGSGTVELDDGQLAHVGFAGKNGHPYVAIGKVLKDMGELSGSITTAKIRTWLETHKDRAEEILHSNPSYIFFKESEEEAPGAFGVKLVAGRSMAVDRESIPMGMPLFVESVNTHDNIPWQRIMFAHDVGSAIKGPARGDIYFGHGPLAGERAGDQNSTGSMYVFVPKENVGEQAVADSTITKPLHQ